MNMKQLRERAKLRTVDVASKIGVGESSVRNWEKGRTIPKLRIDQMGDLLRLYNCSFDELEQAIKESMESVSDESDDPSEMISQSSSRPLAPLPKAKSQRNFTSASVVPGIAVKGGFAPLAHPVGKHPKKRS